MNELAESTVYKSSDVKPSGFYEASRQLFSKEAYSESCTQSSLRKCENIGAGIKKAADELLLQNIEYAHFKYFVDQSDPNTGLIKDRSTPDAKCSIAAVGFALTSYPIAVERGWVSKDDAAKYTLKVLHTLSDTPQGTDAQGTSGYKGFFYHFLDMKTGERAWNCELSTIDTALLMAGVLCSKNYFDGNTEQEKEIRELADKLYKRVDWAWAANADDRVSLGWNPESGFLPYHWGGYNEAMILLLLGMGSPTHPLKPESWKKYTESDQVYNYKGRDYIDFKPLFGHEYSHSWVDFRGIKDDKNRNLGWDYFENSRRATLAQYHYGIDNPQGFKGYSKLDWGWTACDGPGGSFNKVADGVPRSFHTYIARGAPAGIDDGTIAPTAAAAAIAFAPDVVLPTLYHWRLKRPEIWTPNGFSDAFNPTAEPGKPSGWVDAETLGIDQGPIVLMTENYRSGMVWDLMKKDVYLRAGLKQAGFTGGWLDKLNGASSKP